MSPEEFDHRQRQLEDDVRGMATASRRSEDLLRLIEVHLRRISWSIGFGVVFWVIFLISKA